MDQGSFLMDKLENIGVTEVERLVKYVSNLCVFSAAGISHVVSKIKVEN